MPLIEQIKLQTFDNFDKSEMKMHIFSRCRADKLCDSSSANV